MTMHVVQVAGMPSIDANTAGLFEYKKVTTKGVMSLEDQHAG